MSADAKRDIKMAVGWNRLNLRILGVWPDPKIRDNLFSKYRFLIPELFILTFVSCPQSMNLISVWGDIDLMTDNLAMANIPIFNAFLKVLFVWYHREDLKILVAAFEEDWKSCKSAEERTVMVKTAMIARRISIGCMALSVMMLSTYVTHRIVTIMRLDRDHVDKPEHLALCPGYFPYNIRKSPAFELTLIAQLISTYCAATSTTGVDSFISMLVLHACGQFKKLRLSVERMFDENSGTEREGSCKDISKVIKRHEDLNRFAKSIERCFNVLLLLQMLACTVLVCFIGFQAFTIFIRGQASIFQVLFIGSYICFLVVHMYIYCYVGESLLAQSTKLRNSTYKAKWYNVRATEANDLLIIMLRTTLPLHLTAGKFATFSLETFSSIMKTSLGYLSVLLTVTGNHD